VEFKRRRIAGPQKLHRLWADHARRYRITWDREFQGVTIQPHFYACVHGARSLQDPVEIWDFCGRRKPYKTLAKAIQACELNERFWNAAIALGNERHFARRLESLRARAMDGTGTLKRSMLSNLPLWVLKACDPRVLEYLFPASRGQQIEDDEECPPDSQPDALDDLSEALQCLNDDTEESASPAEDQDTFGSTAQTEGQPLKPAPSAKEPDAGPAKQRKPRINKSSRRGRPSAKSTDDSLPSVNKQSNGSRKRKSKQSKS